MNFVVVSPARNFGFVTRFKRNGMFVFTPRTRNSCKARSMRLAASMNRRPLAETFTSSES